MRGYLVGVSGKLNSCRVMVVPESELAIIERAYSESIFYERFSQRDGWAQIDGDLRIADIAEFVERYERSFLMRPFRRRKRKGGYTMALRPVRLPDGLVESALYEDHPIGLARTCGELFGRAARKRRMFSFRT